MIKDPQIAHVDLLMQNVKTKGPLHREIAKSLRKFILTSLREGDRLPPEGELAVKFGVSMVTLRNATLELEQIGLVRRVNGRGVFVHDFKKSQCIALVFGEIAVHPQPLHYKMRQAALLQVMLSREGWQMRSFLRIRAGYGTDGLGGLRADMESGLVGLLLWDDGEIPEDLAKLAVEHHVRILEANKTFAVSNYPKMVDEGVAYLKSKGCRKLAMLTGRDIAPITSEPFERALKARSLSHPKEWLLEDLLTYDYGTGREYIKRLWGSKSNRPDGLLIPDDVIYRSAAHALIEQGVRVPKEVQIIAHANEGDDFLHPFPLALLETRVEENVAATTQTILRYLAGEPVVGAKTGFGIKLFDPSSG